MNKLCQQNAWKHLRKSDIFSKLDVSKKHQVFQFNGPMFKGEVYIWGGGGGVYFWILKGFEIWGGGGRK